MSKKSGIGRTYLSQYMNIKLNKPPKPEILKKLAAASNDIISYQELMEICGYSSPNINNLYDYNFEQIKKKMLNIPLTNEQINTIYELFHPLYTSSDSFDINLSKFIDTLPSEKIEKVYEVINEFIELHENSLNKYGIALQRILKRSDIAKKSHFYMCPVYGQISAGQPNWAEENIEGRLPIDTELMDIINPEEYFFLRVNGESMNNIVKNGAFALIHKQDMVEDGEIAVVLVNGYDATLKRFTKKGDVVVLEPDSTDISFKTQIYDKTTPIKILGKYVGKMEINK